MYVVHFVFPLVFSRWKRHPSTSIHVNQPAGRTHFILRNSKPRRCGVSMRSHLSAKDRRRAEHVPFRWIKPNKCRYILFISSKVLHIYGCVVRRTSPVSWVCVCVSICAYFYHTPDDADNACVSLFWGHACTYDTWSYMRHSKVDSQKQH